MKAASSLHEKIRKAIEGKILSGAWAPGYRIPFERDLMSQYGCARMTVNRALASLVDAGLIVRRRRVGSFVAQPHIRSVILDIPDIKADVVARGGSYGLRLLSRKVRKAARADEKALAGQGPIMVLRCLHLANGRPFALEDRIINLKAVPAAAAADFSVEPPGTWLLVHVPWTEAEHRITAVNADAATSEILDVPAGEACLLLERRTWRGKANITSVRQTFVGATYDLIARFTSKSMARQKHSAV
ncbi:MAG: histidine utilization repressor [Proteobacteria bacterium]|nr:histidine utilization repressor [Pseudomonadota bacterium]